MQSIHALLMLQRRGPISGHPDRYASACKEGNRVMFSISGKNSTALHKARVNDVDNRKYRYLHLTKGIPFIAFSSQIQNGYAEQCVLGMVFSHRLECLLILQSIYRKLSSGSLRCSSAPKDFYSSWSHWRSCCRYLCYCSSLKHFCHRVSKWDHSSPVLKSIKSFRWLPRNFPSFSPSGATDLLAFDIYEDCAFINLYLHNNSASAPK